MSECRDWLSTLWPASFKGVPFYFESDEEEGGRGLVIHKFVNRDDPFVEDLGEEPRFFSGSAYVHGDDADAQAVTLAEVLASRGTGILTVPIRGPVPVQCQTFRRRHERDKLGYAAFEVKFVRDAATFGLVSVGSILNEAFGAVSRAVSAAATLFPQRVTVADQPDHVTGAVTSTISAALAAADVLRVTYPVDPVASASLRDEISAMVLDLSDAVDSGVTPDYAISVASLIVDLAKALPPAAALRAMDELLAAFQPVSIDARSPSAVLANNNAVASQDFVRLAALVGYSVAVLNQTYVSRADGVTARADVAERFERELLLRGGEYDGGLYLALDDLRGRVIEYLSRLINDLAPVVSVKSVRILPSLFFAWRLYADPLRSTELVQRNGVRHPSFMPLEFSALAR